MSTSHHHDHEREPAEGGRVLDFPHPSPGPHTNHPAVNTAVHGTGEQAVNAPHNQPVNGAETGGDDSVVVPVIEGDIVNDKDGASLHWLAGWEVPTVATVVSLLWRVRQAVQQDRRGGGESR